MFRYYPSYICVVCCIVVQSYNFSCLGWHSCHDIRMMNFISIFSAMSHNLSFPRCSLAWRPFTMRFVVLCFRQERGGRKEQSVCVFGWKNRVDDSIRKHTPQSLYSGHLKTSYSNESETATNTKYNRNIMSPSALFIFHRKQAIDMITKSSIRKRMVIEHTIPSELTITGSP